MLINNDRSLIAKGGTLNAPLISKEDFARMFREFCENCSYVADPQDFEQRLLTNTGRIDIDAETLEELDDTNDIDVDYGYLYALPDEVPGKDIRNIIGLRETSAGIPYLGFILVGDTGLEVFRMIWFNGNEFQIYTPYYGNCWNTESGWMLACEIGDENEDEFFCAKYGTDLDTVVNAARVDLIDETAITEEIEAVFSASNLIQNPTLNTSQTNSGNTGSATSNQTSSAPQKTAMGILYDVFNKKMINMIPTLQQSLIAQGATTYDKENCFKNLQDKNVFQKDIYNYILQFNNFDSTVNKMIECTKIAMYIKRFQYHHEGLIL